MILLELEIEDYKQFQGKHTFSPGANGVVAIIGPNGAGKTTLFEAIEWCLYQPREIRNDEIPPRSRPDVRPRVRLRLASLNGTAWEVERTLRKTSATAEVRKISDEGREIVASGSSAVTSYTATKLIGLEHKAFVATFFTRQKELSFFGALKTTERRREVGRLLGLETIRDAQRIIADERTVKKNKTAALQGQFEHESGSRDFEAEKTSLSERLVEVDQAVAAASVAVQAAEQKYNVATSRRSELVKRRDTARQIETEIQRQQKVLSTADATITAARNSLSSLDALESERPALLVRASQLAELEERVARLEVDRERAQRLSSLREQRAQAQTEIDRLRGIATRQIGEVPSSPFSPLKVSSMAEADPLASISQALSEAATVRSADTEGLVTGLRDEVGLQEVVAKAEAEMERYASTLTKLHREMADLQAAGDPAEAQKHAIVRRDHAKDLIAAHEATIAAHTRSLADLDMLINRPTLPVGEPICTMCGRPITEHEAADIKTHAESRRCDIETDIGRLRDEISRHQRVCVVVEDEIKQYVEQALAIEKLTGRIHTGTQMSADKEREVESARYALVAHMQALGRVSPVAQDEIAELQDRLACERAVEALATSLTQIRASLETQLARVSSLTADVDEIGDIDFNPAQLDEASLARDDAKSATSRLLFIDEQATHRAGHESAIAEAETGRTAALATIATLEQQLADFQLQGIDIEIEDVEDEIEDVRQEQQRQEHQRSTHRTERKSIEFDLKQIEKDQDRLAELAKGAEAARVEADDLSHMYDEFNAFEQFVARRVKPQLEDMTSELVRVVTENKYEAVVMDENYGIKVFDGDLGPYPIEHYSGGERDVVALAARLALSRLIGSQAANPPSFLVLDEVFGSLDRDRRANLLDLLGSLAGSAESFQQLFVISHVDDVRVSSAFNEVWRITELADGSSRLENLNASEAAEDL